MSDGASDDVRAFAFPVARRADAGPAWMAAVGREARPASFCRGSAEATDGAGEALPSPVPVPPPAPVVPAAEPRPRPSESSSAAFARAALDHATAAARAVAGAEEQLIELALAIASAVVEREVERDPALLAALARSALEALGTSSGAALRASHDAYAAILDVLGAPCIVADGVTVQVVLDPTLHGVGCVAENEHGRVDSRIAERLRAVRRALDDERRRAAVEEAG